jgi:hypothetical protein
METMAMWYWNQAQQAKHVKDHQAYANYMQLYNKQIKENDGQ